jgi:hypothetical protein
MDQDTHEEDETKAFPVPTAADRMGISERFLRSEIANGRISVCQLGRRQVITPAAIRVYLAKRSIEAQN